MVSDKDLERLRNQAEFMALCERPMPNGMSGDWQRLTDALNELEERRQKEQLQETT